MVAVFVGGRVTITGVLVCVTTCGVLVAVIVIARAGVDVIVEVMGCAGIDGVTVTTSPTVTVVFAVSPQSPLLLWARTLKR